MTQKGIIEISPTFGTEILADNERVFAVYLSESYDNGDDGIVTFKVTTDQLLAKEGFKVTFIPTKFTRISQQTGPISVTPQAAPSPGSDAPDADVKVGELVTD